MLHWTQASMCWSLTAAQQQSSAGQSALESSTTEPMLMYNLSCTVCAVAAARRWPAQLSVAQQGQHT